MMLKHAWLSLKEAMSFAVNERRCLACSSPFLPSLADVTNKSVMKFCPQCKETLERRQAGYCPLCGELAAWPDLPISLCGECLHEAPPWESLLFHNEYKGMLRELLLGLKFNNRLMNAYALALLLSEHPEVVELLHSVDCIIPIPLHKNRLVQRGYNQALEIAKQLLACTDVSLPLLQNSLLRTLDTKPQTGLNRERRRKNLAGAFYAKPEVSGKRILLFDDVLTTGTTLKAASSTLKRAGALSVHITAVAKTGIHFHSTEMMFRE